MAVCSAQIEPAVFAGVIAFEIRVNFRTGAHHPGRHRCDEILSRASSARIASEKPVSANLLAEYGDHVRDGDSAHRWMKCSRFVRHRWRASEAQLHDSSIRCPEMQPHRAIEIFELHMSQRTDFDGSGVIDKDVDLAEAVAVFAEQQIGSGLFQAGRRGSSELRRRKPPDRISRGRVHPCRAREEQLSAIGANLARDFQTETARSTGNQGTFCEREPAHCRNIQRQPAFARLPARSTNA